MVAIRTASASLRAESTSALAADPIVFTSWGGTLYTVDAALQ